MSTDSEDEDLCLIKEATDDSFLNAFKAKDCRGTHNPLPKKKENHIPSIRVIEDENKQYRLFQVIPQFQNYVAKALTNKLDKLLEERLIEYPTEKKRKRRRKYCIKLLKSSSCPIDIKKSERDNTLNDFSTYKHNSNYKKAELKNYDQDLNVINSVVISGEDVLNFIDVKCWSNRSKAQVFRYARDKKGILNYLESHYMTNVSDVIK